MMQGMAASNTIIQTIVSEDKRGRVMSYYTMAFMGMAPFGSLLAGTMANGVGAPVPGPQRRCGGACWLEPSLMASALHAVILNGFVLVLGAAWFSDEVARLRKPDSTHLSGDGTLCQV